MTRASSSCVKNIIIAVLIIVCILALVLLHDRWKYTNRIRLGCDALQPVVYTHDAWDGKAAAQTYSPINALMSLEIAIRCSQTNCPTVAMLTPPGYDVSSRLVVRGRFGNVERMVCQCFRSINPLAAAAAPADVLIVFTGTVFIDEWMRDVDFPETQVPWLGPGGVSVHSGFLSVYNDVRSAIQAYLRPTSQTVWICGHSLGGALATLCALDITVSLPTLRVSVFTFASPRVGNTAFANAFSASAAITEAFRVYNTEDVVPSLPPPVIAHDIYTHVSPSVAFTLNEGALVKNHVGAYLATLRSQS